MDDTSPATKADLAAVKTDLKAELLQLELRLDKKFERVQESIDQVLDVVIAVDKRQKATAENHEKRIVRLEEAIA